MTLVDIIDAMAHHGNLWHLLWQLLWQLLGFRWHLLPIDAIIDAITVAIKDAIAMASFNRITYGIFCQAREINKLV